MKRTISVLLSVILLLSLTACGDSLDGAEVIKVNTAQDSETYVFGEDYQQNWNDWGSNAGKTCTMGEDGYYYYSQYGNRLLYFYDFTEDTSVPVCNQPNCEHSSAECNAILTGLCSNIIYIQYYDGNLYVIGVEAGLGRQDVCLYRISADGAARGKIGTILSLSSGQSISCVVHRGYVYCTLTQDGSLNKTSTKIYRLSLSGDADAEVIYTFDAAYGAGAQLKAYGNYLYISYMYYTDQDANAYVGEIYRYQIHTGETEWVLENTCKPFVVDDSYIYYSTTSQTLAYNMKSKESIVLLEQGPMYLAMYGDYLYCDNEFHVWLSDDVDYSRRSIVVIDTNTHKTVASIPFTISGTEMIGACGSDLLGAGTYGPIYVYDLDLALNSGEPHWEELN